VKQRGKGKGNMTSTNFFITAAKIRQKNSVANQNQQRYLYDKYFSS